MEIIRIAWVAILIFFMLTLFFAWSKMYLIGKKIAELTALIRQSDELGTSASVPLPAEPSDTKPKG